MEELLTLKQYLLAGEINAALQLVTELEEMSKEDKINNIVSYAVVLLTHLIKQTVEKGTTKSWEISIRNAVRQINRRNKRRKAGGYYLSEEELLAVLEEALPDALDQACLEVASGQYDAEELADLIDKETIISQALQLLKANL